VDILGLAAPEWFFSSRVSTSLTKILCYLFSALFCAHTYLLYFRSQFHFLLCTGKSMFKPLSHLGQGDKWTTKWFLLKRTLIHNKSKEVATQRRKMRSHLQSLLRFLLGCISLRRPTLTDYLLPRKEGRSRTF
jgi:hypothetical protein